MTWRQTCLGATLVAIGASLIAAQIISAIFYFAYPVEWILCGLWAGIVVIATGVLAVLDRHNVQLMAVVAIFCAVMVVLVHTTGSVLIHVLSTSRSWRHTRYVRYVDDFYLMLSWMRTVLGLLVIVFDAALLCHMNPPKPAPKVVPA